MTYLATMSPQEQSEAVRRADYIGELRMVAIFRADLELPVGKIAVQAGHAFLTAWRIFAELDPYAAQTYV